MSVDIHASCCRLRGNVSPESDPQLVKQAPSTLQSEAMQPATKAQRQPATCKRAAQLMFHNFHHMHAFSMEKMDKIDSSFNVTNVYDLLVA